MVAMRTSLQPAIGARGVSRPGRTPRRVWRLEQPAMRQALPAKANWSDHVARIARDRDKVAFAELFAYFAPRLKSYLMRSGSADTAEELAQETMLTVWRKADIFDASRA